MIRMHYEAYPPELSYGILEEGPQNIAASRYNVHSRFIEANDPSEFESVARIVGVLSSLAVKDGVVCAEWTLDRGGHNPIVRALTNDMQNDDVIVKQTLKAGEDTLEIGGFCIVDGWQPTLYIGSYDENPTKPVNRAPLSDEIKTSLRALTYGTAEEMRRLRGSREYPISIQYDFGDPDLLTEQGKLQVDNPYGY